MPGIRCAAVDLPHPSSSQKKNAVGENVGVNCTTASQKRFSKS
jgi:hypothetical protein